MGICADALNTVSTVPCATSQDPHHLAWPSPRGRGSRTNRSIIGRGLDTWLRRNRVQGRRLCLLVLQKGHGLSDEVVIGVGGRRFHHEHSLGAGVWYRKGQLSQAPAWDEVAPDLPYSALPGAQATACERGSLLCGSLGRRAQGRMSSSSAPHHFVRVEPAPITCARLVVQ